MISPGAQVPRCPGVAPRNFISFWRQSWTCMWRRRSCMSGQALHTSSSFTNMHQGEPRYPQGLCQYQAQAIPGGSPRLCTSHPTACQTSLPGYSTVIPHSTWPGLNHAPSPNSLCSLFQRIAFHYLYRISYGKNLRAVSDSSLSSKPFAFSQPLRLANSTS